MVFRLRQSRIISPGAADQTIETELLDGGQQGGNLQAVAADFAGSRHGDASGDGILNVTDDEFGAELLRAPVAKLVQFGK